MFLIFLNRKNYTFPKSAYFDEIFNLCKAFIGGFAIFDPNLRFKTVRM